MNFDSYSKTYEDDVSKLLPSTANEHQFYLQAKVEALVRRCQSEGISPESLNLLDIGCGVGLMHGVLAPCFKTVTGIDISRESVELAKERNPTVTYLSYAGDCLPFETGTVDAVLLVCTLHHVPPGQWGDFLSEIFRVLVPGGHFFVVEHNPWNPATNHIVSRCAFDADAVLLSAPECRRQARAVGFASLATDFILFLPFKIWFFRILENVLFRSIPLGAQYLSTFRKPANNS
jgi:SAM-dependent methyltransferase